MSASSPLVAFSMSIAGRDAEVVAADRNPSPDRRPAALPVAVPMLAYWPATAVPLPVQVIEAPAASVSVGQLTVTPWSSVTVTLVNVSFAGVGDDIGPVDRITDHDLRAWRRIGIVAVGGFLDVDAGSNAKVVAADRYPLPDRRPVVCR